MRTMSFGTAMNFSQIPEGGFFFFASDTSRTRSRRAPVATAPSFPFSNGAKSSSVPDAVAAKSTWPSWQRAELADGRMMLPREKWHWLELKVA